MRLTFCTYVHCPQSCVQDAVLTGGISHTVKCHVGVCVTYFKAARKHEHSNENPAPTALSQRVLLFFASTFLSRTCLPCQLTLRMTASFSVRFRLNLSFKMYVFFTNCHLNVQDYLKDHGVGFSGSQQCNYRLQPTEHP